MGVTLVLAVCAITSLRGTAVSRDRLERRGQSGAEADHVAGPRRHRDAVRHRRRQRGRRRVELRQVSAGGGVAAESRRADRSGFRAHPVAQARPRHRLRHPDGFHRASRSRAACRCSGTSTPDSPTSRRRFGRSATRIGRVDGGGRRRRGDRTGHRRDSDARGRAAAAEDRARLRPRAGHAARHLRERRHRFHARHARRGRRRRCVRRRQAAEPAGHDGDAAGAGARGDRRGASRPTAGRPTGSRASARSGTALPSLPAVRTGRVHLLADDRLSIPGPRVAEAIALLADVLHPKPAK